MEEKLLQIFKLAEKLNTNTSKVYPEIQYTANNSHRLEIAVRSKKDYSYIERCDIKYKGIYSFINREFINKEFRSTKYINREEDCGYPGLRKSKLSYHPIYLLKKSLIII